MDIQQLKDQQILILNQIDQAIALFDSSDRLILFNPQLAAIWGISVDQLAAQPSLDDICAEITSKKLWLKPDWEHLRQTLRDCVRGEISFCIQQHNQIYLEVHSQTTASGGRLLTFRDITDHRNTQLSLNTEVRRLRFLLGLNERLQDSDNLDNIAQFALNYLVHTTNAAFGDVKVILGEGENRITGMLGNQISGHFVATYGEPAVAEMKAALSQGIPYGEGLLWDVVRTGEPRFVKDYANHPKAFSPFRHPGIGQLGIFPIPATNGEIIGVLTLESRDLTKMQEYPQLDMLFAACRTLGTAIERAEAQERLRQSNEKLERASQLKSEFLASMSHELRTPLNSVLGFADLLKRQNSGTLNSRQLNQVQFIEKSGWHLLHLINDILDLSKIESGKTELNLESVNIHELCSECLKMVQPRADKKCLALSLESDYRITQVLLDKRRVRQIMINLLSNAIKFTPEGGKVRLSGHLAYGSQIEGDYRPDCSPINDSTPYLCLEVQDSGIGIPQDRWHLLFQPFQQIDSSLTRRHEGTGLGLVLTKRLAELHGGTVSLQSQVNQGSRFRVWLPLTEMRRELAKSYNPEPERQEVITPEPETPKLHKVDCPRILVVEDQPFNQLLITEVLELEGYQVELIADGNTMLDMINSTMAKPELLPDVILMDIQLPEVDGFELIRRLKQSSLWKVVPVVAVTAMVMSGDRERCLAAGADGYLSKPLDVDEVLATVKNFLES
ncbi:hybrid sensor histidine kinase/response regulator [Limnospira indica]|uniref:Circadian input-output histidine kinase CikA n=1 Tax=Limnospira indica PCC 8005 TaxID=376219 RepID=A0A9P1P122_9CYAN|nr:ATP-binding protein [Limnospira indica]CDM98086.1 Histidine kinase [Limnospira indica PCC 8005]